MTDRGGLAPVLPTVVHCGRREEHPMHTWFGEIAELGVRGHPRTFPRYARCTGRPADRSGRH